jgi:hypothetical protein
MVCKEKVGGCYLGKEGGCLGVTQVFEDRWVDKIQEFSLATTFLHGVCVWGGVCVCLCACLLSEFPSGGFEATGTALCWAQFCSTDSATPRDHWGRTVFSH